MKLSSKTKVFSLLVSTGLLFGLSSQAFAAGGTGADTTNASVTLQSGAFDVIAPQASADFGNIQVDGTVKNADVNFAGSLVAKDFRGTGAGWRVNVRASQFTHAGGTTLTLPTSTLTLHSVSSITPEAGTTSPNPTSLHTTDAVIDTGSDVGVASAALNNGMGAYDVAFVNPSMSISVDTSLPVIDGGADTLYTSTITWTIVTGQVGS